jgi:hypothetical protein
MKFYTACLFLAATIVCFQSCSKKNSSQQIPPSNSHGVIFSHTVTGFRDITVRVHADTIVDMPVTATFQTMGDAALSSDTLPDGVSVSPDNVDVSRSPINIILSFHIKIDSIGSFPVTFKLWSTTMNYQGLYKFNIITQ